jgi:hypothetical protein
VIRSPEQLLRSFSWRHGLSGPASPEGSTVYQLTELMLDGFAYPTSYGLRPPFPIGGPPSLPRHSFAHSSGTGILNLFPISYAFRPDLRGRLTLGGRSFPRKSWEFGGRDFNPSFVTHVRIITSARSSVASASPSLPALRSPTTTLARHPRLRYIA